MSGQSLGGENEFGSAAVRLRCRFGPDLQRTSLADESSRPGAENHAETPEPSSVVVLLRGQTEPASHCVLSTAENQGVRRREGEVREADPPKVPEVKLPNCDAELKIKFRESSFRHDERHHNRKRRPSSRNVNRRKAIHVTKRPDDRITSNAIPDYESPDCVVSEWNAWSACSKSCGLGEMFRNRTIVKAARKSGFPCPQLTERSWCGSSRCKPSLNNENIDNSSYFKW